MAKPLNVLIGCEESGIVREAFRALGHHARSCDLLPARDGSIYHIQADVRSVLDGYEVDGERVRWDLGIFHPTCTYLCNSGVRWFTTIPKIQKPGVLYGQSRQDAMVEGCHLFRDLYFAPIPRVAVENPVMHQHAREYLQLLGVPEFSQSVQPNQFGDRALKRTCFWLRGGLSPLTDTDYIEPPPSGTPERRVWSECHQASPGPNRARDRSVTYRGIAAAMAWQWGGDARGGDHGD